MTLSLSSAHSLLKHSSPYYYMDNFAFIANNQIIKICSNLIFKKHLTTTLILKTNSSEDFKYRFVYYHCIMLHLNAELGHCKIPKLQR